VDGGTDLDLRAPCHLPPDRRGRGVLTRVLVEQTSAVDPSRLGEQVGHLGFDELRAVDAALRMVLAL
jgi:mRNA interferase MazF